MFVYRVFLSVFLSLSQAGLHKLELNPFWKDGGSGLPPVASSSTALRKGECRNKGTHLENTLIGFDRKIGFLLHQK